MNDLEQLRERLANRFSDASLAIDTPDADTGTRGKPAHTAPA